MAHWPGFDDLDGNQPGILAGVVTGGVVKDWASFGSAELGGAPLGTRSLFYVASIAKQFTAAAIGVLALQERLSLDDPVRRWIPELAESWRDVRLEHLIAHTAGLANGNEIDRASGWGPNSSFTTWDRIDVIAKQVPKTKHGEVHSYSNHGYVLLAGVVDRVTGERFGDVVRRELFVPAGMHDSRFVDTPGPSPVTGWRNGRHRVDISFECCGDGGLVTNLQDLACWDAWLPASDLAPMMLGDRPALANGRLAHDAWGISIRSHHGLRVESHGGSFDGYLTTFVRFSGLDITIVLLANTDGFAAGDFSRRAQLLARAVVGEHLDLRKPSWTETHGDRLLPRSRLR